MTVATLASAFRWALRFGVIERREVIKWADDQIAEQDDPDYWFIEVSTSQQRDLEGRLSEAPGGLDEQDALNQFLGLVHQQWHQSQLMIGALRGIGWVLHCDGLLESPEGEGDWGVALECIGEELDEGWSTEADFREYASKSLQHYVAFTELSEVVARIRNKCCTRSVAVEK